MKPINCEPLSPIQAWACFPGRRLNGRKPRTPAPSATAITRTSLGSCCSHASQAKNAAAITARLPASPSMLSSRLKAFVMPTSQSSPIGIVSQGLWTICTPVPVDRTIVGSADLGRELRGRRQRANVVDEAGEEKEACTGEDADELRRHRERSEEDGEPHACR